MELSGVGRALNTIKKVVYGKPYIQVTVKECAARKSRVLLLVSKTLDRTTTLVSDLETALGSKLVGKFAAVREHTPDDDVVNLAKCIKEAGADTVLTLGGGSLIDAAKAAKIALAYNFNCGEDFRQLHLPGKRSTYVLDNKFKTNLTVINIPTTLSAGEYSVIAGVTDTKSGRKIGYVHGALAGDVTVLDPAVTAPTPEGLFLSTGVRALDHCVETICSSGTNIFADTLALKGLSLLAKNLSLTTGSAETLNGKPNLEARLNCQLGAWLSMQGICQGVPMGASHGMSHALASLGVSHGHCSCILLPHVLKYNHEKIPAEKRQAITTALGYDCVQFTPHSALGDFLKRLGLPQSLKDVGLAKKESLGVIAHQSLMSDWVKSNIKPVTETDAHKILIDAYEGILKSML